jgi:vacuolar-type H+-ATPase subunit C/Vma6
MELLRKDLPPGYPADYLLARIRGRRGELIRDWEPLLTGDTLPVITEEVLWRGLLKELFWVYGQMNGGLRKTFGPVFLNFELRTLVLCLRNKSALNMATVGELLRYSLLCDEIRSVLREERDMASTIGVVTDCLTAFSPRFSGLAQINGGTGLRSFEENLLRASLEHFAESRLHPLIRNFFIHIIDLRNLLGLYKHLRWGIGEAPPFVSGGSINEAVFQDIMARGEMKGVENLLTKMSKKRFDGPWEVRFLRALTGELREAGREPLGIGVILEYIWRRYIEARNVGTLVYGKGLEPEQLAKELIR